MDYNSWIILKRWAMHKVVGLRNSWATSDTSVSMSYSLDGCVWFEGLDSIQECWVDWLAIAISSNEIVSEFFYQSDMVVQKLTLSLISMWDLHIYGASPQALLLTRSSSLLFLNTLCWFTFFSVLFVSSLRFLVALSVFFFFFSPYL